MEESRETRGICSTHHKYLAGQYHRESQIPSNRIKEPKRSEYSCYSLISVNALSCPVPTDFDKRTIGFTLSQKPGLLTSSPRFPIVRVDHRIRPHSSHHDAHSIGLCIVHHYNHIPHTQRSALYIRHQPPNIHQHCIRVFICKFRDS